MKNKLLISFTILFFLIGFASAANSQGVLQIWRNASTGTNVSSIDNNGNWDVSGNISSDNWFRGLFNWIVGSSSRNYLSFNGSQLDFNETYLNSTFGSIGNNSYIKRDGTNNFTSNFNAGAINFSVDANTLFVDSSNNRIGIGTSTPTEALTLNGGDIDFTRGDTGAIHSVGGISFDWSAGTYDNSSSHGIETKSESGTASDSLRINSFNGITNTLDSNSNDANSVFKIQKESMTNGVDLFSVDETGLTYILGNVGIGTTSPNVIGVNANNRILDIRTPNAGFNGQIQLGTVGTASAIGETLGQVNFYGMNGGATSVARSTISTVLDGAVNSTKFTFDTMNAGTLGTAMTILGSGNVGIGTTSPAYKLSIETANVGDSNGLAIGNTSSSSTGKKLTLGYFQTSDYAKIQAIDSGVAYKNIAINPDGGNVGIGTTSPGYKLDVNGSDIRVSSTSGYYGRFGSWSGSTFLSSDTANIPLSFYTNNGTGATERMRITSTGNVGIGTTNPNYNLDINGTLRVSSFAYVGNTSSTYLILNAASGRVSVGSASANDNLILNGKGTGATYVNYDAGTGGLRVYNGSSTLQQAQIGGTGNSWINSGNVGIGTTSPTTTLYVNGTFNIANTTGTNVLTTSATGTSLYGTNKIYAGSGTASGYLLAGSNNQFDFYNSTGSSAIMYIQYPASSSAVTNIGRNALYVQGNNGNVGIGTTTPTGGKLNVVGAANITGLLTFGSLAANSLNNTYFAANSINARVIAPGSVNATHIIPNAINTTHILDSTILTGDIATGAITNTDILLNSINTTQIIDGTILPADLSANVNTSFDARYLLNSGDTASGDYNFDAGTLFINSSGNNLGVGTTSPQVGMKMDVRSDPGIAGSSGITAYGYNGDGGIAIKGYGYATSGTGINYGLYGLSGGSRATGTNVGGYFTASGAATNYALITGSGNVGIGIANPISMLQVAGNVTLATTSGNVGINTTSPQNTLNVVGTMNVTGTSYLNKTEFNGGWTDGGVSIIDGNVYATAAYFYNITGLEVSTLRINGSLLPATGFDDTFDLGNSTLRWRDLYLSRNAYVGGTITQQGFNVLDTRYNSLSNFTNDIGIGNWSANYSDYLTTKAYALNDSRWTSNYSDYLTIRTYAMNDTNYNASGLIKDWNATGYIKNWNATGYISNWQTAINAANVSAAYYANTTVNNSMTNYVNARDVVANLHLHNAANITAGTFGAGNFVFQNNLTVDTNTLFVDSSTNRVGIGTASPGSNLHINGTSGLIIEDSSFSNKAFINLIRTGASYGDYQMINDNGIFRINYGAGDGTFGSSPLTITNTGNVGIGTTAPSHLLHLNGTSPIIHLTDTTTGADSLIDADSSAGSLRFSADESNEIAGSSLNFYVDGSFKAKIDDSGNVGIGTASPLTKLHVYSASATGSFNDTYAVEKIESGESRLQISSLDDGSMGSGVILSTGNKSWSIMSQAISDSNKFYIGYRSSSANEDIMAASSKYLTIDTSGNVGIGTPTPTGGKLNVVGDANITGLLRFGSLPASSLNNTYFAANSINARVIAPGSVNATHIIPSAINTTHILDSTILTGDIATGAVTNTDILLNSINTTQIIDGTILEGDIAQTSSLDNTEIADIYLFNTGDTATGNYTFDTNTLFIDSSTNRVGIGTASPVQKLQVSGNIYSNGGNFFVDGTYGFVGNDGLNGIYPSTSTNGVIIKTASTDRLKIDNSGNVGIGTTSPSYKLDVNGTIKGANDLILTGPDNTRSISLYYGTGWPYYSSSITQTGAGEGIGGTRGLIINEQTGQTVSNYGIGFATNATNRMFIQHTGNVGIGTINPTQTLNVVGSANITGSMIIGNSNITTLTNGDVNVW